MALGRIIISIKIMRRTLFSPLVLFYNILKKKEDLLLLRPLCKARIPFFVSLFHSASVSVLSLLRYSIRVCRELGIPTSRLCEVSIFQNLSVSHLEPIRAFGAAPKRGTEALEPSSIVILVPPRSTHRK